MTLSIQVRKQMGERLVAFKGTLEAQIYGLMGSSGTGKTTLLRMISGLLVPDSGTIICDGETWFDQKQQINVPVKTRKVGFVFQNLALFPNMTTLQNIEFYKKLKAYPRHFHPDMQAQLIAQLGLSPYLNRPVNKLSGGQRQRVALCRALVLKPRLLLMDEPFTGLDDDLRQTAIDLTKNVLKQSPTMQVIIVSHRRDELKAFTDNILQLQP